MHRSTLEADRLAAAEAICAHYVERGTTRLPVAGLAAAAGISERTFHRYFAAKPDTVVPLFEENSRIVNALVAHGEAPSLRVLLTEAHERMFGGEHAERTAALLPLVFQDPGMWSAFLRAMHDGEQALHPLLAHRTGADARSFRARAASSAFTTANRIALEAMVQDGADRLATFAGMLDAFPDVLPGDAALRAPAERVRSD